MAPTTTAPETPEIGDDDLVSLGAESIDLVTVILGHTALIAATLPATDERRVDVEAIGAATRRLCGILSQLLTATTERRSQV
jgi:hypothetical protein